MIDDAEKLRRARYLSEARRLTADEVAESQRERDARIDVMTRAEMATSLREFARQPHWRLYPRLMLRIADELETTR